jgi:hypothetical protein
MFCKLHALYAETGMRPIELQDCSPSCKYYNDDTTKCAICNYEIESLYEKEKYNWNISLRAEFWDAELLHNEDTLYNVIKMIHPSFPSVWILKWVSLDDNGNRVSSHSVCSPNEAVLTDIAHVNIYLKRKCKYDGRKITEDDFKIRKEIKDDISDEEI